MKQSGVYVTNTSLMFAYESGVSPLSTLAKHQLPSAMNIIRLAVLS